ncbi:MAG: isoprenylcysteine carboxylmethyltransferase family protein [Acidobacteriia bacterium]|nr:isoprenylcysteine carboxylmethyltransferase family protein [Terriglobia bacterium]
MNRTFIIRAISLYVPLVSALALWNWRKPAQREATGALLATAWNLPALLGVNLMAMHFGWWSFSVNGGTLFGMPVDLWIGWSAFWGTAAGLLFRYTPLWIVAIVLGIADLVLMPMCAPVVMLGKRWLIGECIALSVCVAPGLLLARWTRDCRSVKRRALLQTVCFSGLFLLSTVAVANASERLERLAHITSLHLHLLAIAIFLAALPGVSAVQEFAKVGQGTPLPFDPPQQLVRSGIYRYIANPMQSSTALLLIVMAIGLRLPWLLLGSLVSIVYSAGLAHWDEDSDLRQRYGQSFLDYRRQVRNWLPRWRPAINQPARIYLAEDCFKCSQMAAFLKSLTPIGLEVVAAEDHPRRNLERMTYESDAVEDDGLAALARAMEHVNLGYALAGMALRLPGINAALQAIVDASGGGPMPVRRRSCEIPAPRIQKTAK